MTYDWQAHTEAAGARWRVGDWDWSPDRLDHRPPGPTRVLMACSDAFGVTLEQIHGKHPKFVQSRQAAALMMRRWLSMTYPAIARVMKRDDHTGIIHNRRKAEDHLKHNQDFRAKYNRALDAAGPFAGAGMFRS